MTEVSSWVSYLALFLSTLSIIWNVFNTFLNRNLRRDIAALHHEGQAFMEEAGTQILKDMNELSNIPVHLKLIIDYSSENDDLCQKITDFQTETWIPTYSAARTSIRHAVKKGIISKTYYAEIVIPIDESIHTSFRAMQNSISRKDEYSIFLQQLEKPIEGIISHVRACISEHQINIRNKYLKL